MSTSTNKMIFYADCHFVNATMGKEEYKNKVYPIVLMAVVIRVSKPRKPHTILRAVEKSRHAKRSCGSFSIVMQEMERDSEDRKSSFKIHLPPSIEKKVKQQAESEGKMVHIMNIPGHRAPIYVSPEAQQFIDSKNKGT